MEYKLVITAEETSKMLGIGMNKIYSLLCSGEIPSRRVGRKYLISRLALENWLNSSSTKEEMAYERLYQQSR